MLPRESSHKVIISDDKVALLSSKTLSFIIAAAITIASALGAATTGFAAIVVLLLLMLVLLSWNMWSRRYINMYNISSTLIVKVSTYANKMFIHTQNCVQHK